MAARRSSAGDRNAVAGAARVELAAIDEAEIGVEEEEVRGAGGVVGVGHGLRFVVEIGKDEADGLSLLLESGGTVVGVGG